MPLTNSSARWLRLLLPHMSTELFELPIDSDGEWRPSRERGRSRRAPGSAHPVTTDSEDAMNIRSPAPVVCSRTHVMMITHLRRCPSLRNRGCLVGRCPVLVPADRVWWHGLGECISPGNTFTITGAGQVQHPVAQVGGVTGAGGRLREAAGRGGPNLAAACR